MDPEQHISNVVYRIAEGTAADALDVFGPTVEFLRRPDDSDADFCVMRGVVPPGVTVPLHSHDDAEDFYIVDGTQQVLIHGTTACNGGTLTPETTCGCPAGHRTLTATSPTSQRSTSSSRLPGSDGSFWRSGAP
jgi:hypothetical protein